MLNFNRRLDLWLPTYLIEAPARAYGRLRRRGRLTHIIFLVCDHFEPRHGVSDEQQPFERLRAWKRGFARLQERCRASFGTVPMHTWFYPPHHGAEHLSGLAEMVFDGLGEVELHYHHDGDTADTLTRDLTAALAEYHRWGLLLESGERPRTAFGFVHGDWALCNSGGGKFCGVNDELTILQALGCWGDLTMPSGNDCQTRKINSIYYAVSDPRQAKSHNWGADARVGSKDPPGLFLMQGPLGINWRGPGYPRIENASLTSSNWGRPDRIPKWLDCNIHVKGRPEWQFVKLHTHGAMERDFDALFGQKAYEMHRILNEKFNDGRRYRLHYVTARQAYNIAKAAEHGKEGNPADWLDYRIQPQASVYYTVNARHRLVHCTPARLAIADIEPGASVRIRTRIGPVSEISGQVTAVDIDDTAGTIRFEAAAQDAEVAVELGDGFRLGPVDGGTLVEAKTASAHGRLRLVSGKRCTLKYRGGPGAPAA